MRVLEVVGCCSSVVRALVAKTRVPGFDSLATTNIFSHFSFSPDPCERKFQSSFYEGSELDNCDDKALLLLLYTDLSDSIFI